MEDRYELLREMLDKVIDEDRMSLITILGGGAIEAFDRVLNDEVLPNIVDINTDAKPREITLKVAVVPADEGRSMLAFAMNCKSTKLSGHESIKGLAEIKLDEKGRTYARERIAPQQQLPFGNVKPIRGGKIG